MSTQHPSSSLGSPSDPTASPSTTSESGTRTPQPASSVVLDDTAIQRALTRMAHEIVERHSDLSKLYLVAIPNGGVPLGRILQRTLEALSGVALPMGILDTTRLD